MSNRLSLRQYTTFYGANVIAKLLAYGKKGVNSTLKYTSTDRTSIGITLSTLVKHLQSVKSSYDIDVLLKRHDMFNLKSVSKETDIENYIELVIEAIYTSHIVLTGKSLTRTTSDEIELILTNINTLARKSIDKSEIGGYSNTIFLEVLRVLIWLFSNNSYHISVTNPELKLLCSSLLSMRGMSSFCIRYKDDLLAIINVCDNLRRDIHCKLGSKESNITYDINYIEDKLKNHYSNIIHAGTATVYHEDVVRDITTKLTSLQKYFIYGNHIKNKKLVDEALLYITAFISKGFKPDAVNPVSLDNNLIEKLIKSLNLIKPKGLKEMSKSNLASIITKMTQAYQDLESLRGCTNFDQQVDKLDHIAETLSEVFTEINHPSTMFVIANDQNFSKVMVQVDMLNTALSKSTDIPQTFSQYYDKYLDGVKYVMSFLKTFIDAGTQPSESKTSLGTSEEKQLPEKSNYYDAGGVNTLEAIRSKLTPEEYMGFLKGNALKYLLRCNHKGQHNSDIAKAYDYVRWMKELTETK